MRLALEHHRPCLHPTQQGVVSSMRDRGAPSTVCPAVDNPRKPLICAHPHRRPPTCIRTTDRAPRTA